NMNPIVSQQAIALDNSLVAPEKRLKIERCNPRIAFTKPKKEETYQVTLEALKLSSCYPTFQITTKVPEIYMHQFWNTINKIGNTYAYNFKLDKKKCRVDTKSHLSKSLATLAVVKCYLQYVLIKCTRLGGHLLLSLTDFMYQADNRETSSARKEHMPYTRFTKVIIDHFISKDNTIFMRNKINLHTARDDSLLSALKFVSKIEDCQKYGTLIPNGMINDDIKLSTTYKTYIDYTTRKVPPKKARKIKKPASLKLKISVSKKKAPAKTDRGKGIELFSDATLLEKAQLKKTLRKSKRETHKLQASGSSEGADFESEVPDEQTDKTKDTSEGTGVKPGVPDMSKEDSYESDEDSWVNSEDENDDFNDEDDDGSNDEDSGNDDDCDYEEEEQDEEYLHTLKKDKSDNKEKIDTDMTNAEQGGEDQQNASHESGFKLEEDDGHVALMTVHDKSEDTIQFAEAVSSIPGIVDQYLASKMKETVDVTVRLQSNKLKEEAKAENQELFNQVDSTMKAIIKEHVKAQTSYAVAASLSEFELEKILIDKMEANKSINRSDIQKNLYNALVESYNSDKDIITSYGDVVTLKRGRDDQDKDEDPFAGSN
ncbi:hypothetical protein Tco_0556639, partial [Tanacetum coccineum]